MGSTIKTICRMRCNKKMNRVNHKLLAMAQPHPPHRSPMQLLPGPRCYMDAATPAPGTTRTPKPAGLGLFMHNTASLITSVLFVQERMAQTRDPLHAEEQALLLSSTITAELNLDQVNYISDNQILVTTLNKRDYTNEPDDWRLRPLLYQFQDNTVNRTYQVTKINRKHNKTAHNQAIRVLASPQAAPTTYNCNHVGHHSQCSVITAMQNINWGAITLVSATCF